MEGKRRTGAQWYKLDNAGFMYSAIQRDNYSSVYRFSAVMTQLVDTKALQVAIDKTMPRFPGFQVRMRKGLFWHYFEPNLAEGPFLKEDMRNPCQPIRFGEDNGWLIRFFHYGNRISVELFHALADGAGAQAFFCTLLAVYLRELGWEMPNTHGIMDIGAPPKPEEREDAYRRYATARNSFSPPMPKAYHAKFTPEPFYTLNVTMGFLPLDQLREVAGRYKVTVTEYLAAVLISAIMAKQRREGRKRELPVALAIPINLRPWFPTETLRNFMITVRPYIDPEMGEYTFSEIVAQVHHYMKLHITRQEMQSVITRNIRAQDTRILQMMPAPLKNIGVNLSYHLKGSRPYSTTYTNPGRMVVPPEMEPYIQHVEVILGQSYTPKVNCASISFGNKMEITFASTVKETDIQRDFFRHLVREGLPVKIVSNQRRE